MKELLRESVAPKLLNVLIPSLSDIDALSQPLASRPSTFEVVGSLCSSQYTKPHCPIGVKVVLGRWQEVTRYTFFHQEKPLKSSGLQTRFGHENTSNESGNMSKTQWFQNEVSTNTSAMVCFEITGKEKTGLAHVGSIDCPIYKEACHVFVCSWWVPFLGLWFSVLRSDGCSCGQFAWIFSLLEV